jgi:non-ribosomal peptide synthetase component F
MWQRALVAGAALDGQRDYWKRKLDRLPDLRLPTDHPRPEAPTFRTSRLPIRLPPTLAESLKTVSAERGCTVFVTLLAALSVVLSRLTGSTDVRIGALIAARGRPELEGVIGLFLNTVLLRTELSGDPTLGAVLQRVCETVIEALDHADLPFEEMLGELAKEQRLESAAVFQVMFLFENPPPNAARIDGLEIEPVDVDRALTEASININVTVTTFDLIFRIGPRADGLFGSLVYKKELFSAETAQRVLAHLETVLHQLTCAIDLPLSQLPPPT